MVGEPGSDPIGVSCAYQTSEVGFINVTRVDLGDDAAAAEFVAQPADDTRTVDGFDAIHAGFVGDPALSEYRMLLQKGPEVFAGRTANCPDEETCDESFAALLSTLARAEQVPDAEACADDSGAAFRVLPLVAGTDGVDDAFALVNEDGDVTYSVTTSGVDTNVVFAMIGAPVDESAVEMNSGGDVVAVNGTPVMTNGADLESVGNVLEKSWAIGLDRDHSAVTTYAGDAESPFVEGRFFVSESSPCIPAEALQEGEDRAVD